MKKLLIPGIALLCQTAFPQAAWEKIYGTDSSFSLGVKFMIDTAHIWGSSGGAIYFSPDWGESWEEKFYHDNYQFSDIFFVDSLTGWAVGWSEVLKTEDGGQSWTLQSLPNPLGLDVQAVYFMNPDTGWIAGSYMEIYATHDGGDNWFLIHDFVYGGHVFLYDIHFIDENHGCAVGGGLSSAVPAILATTDGGATWTGTHPDGDGVLHYVQYVNDSVIWTGDHYGSLFKSTNCGLTWGSPQIIPAIGPLDMHLFNESEAFMGGGSAHTAYTSDAWNSYVYHELFYYNSFLSFTFSEDMKGIAAGLDNFLRSSDGGHNWSRLNDRFYRISFFDLQNGWIIQEHLNKNFLKTIDGGSSWIEVDAGNTGSLFQMDFPDDSLGFAITDKSELLKTSDAGNSWEIVQLPFDSTYYSDIQFIDGNTGFITASPNILYKTTNGGLDWEQYTFNETTLIHAVEFLNDLEGWVTGREGFLAHTIDGGTSWEIKELHSYNLSDVDFIDQLHGFIVASDGSIHRTIDGGEIWEDLGDFFTLPANVSFSDAKNGWVTDENSVYRTYDGGISWTEMLDASSSNFCDQVTGFWSLDTSNAWICTMDGRVFKYSNPLITGESLSQLQFHFYPNPVSSQLVLEFESDRPGPLSIHIFSIDGRLVLSRITTPGSGKQVILSLDHFPQGVYLMNIECQGFSKNCKILKI